MKKIIIDPVNGLMNRFRALASAKILADHTNRELLVNWKSEWCCNININDIVDDNFFNIGYDVNRSQCFFHSGREKGSEHPFVQSMIDTDNDIVYLQAGGNFYPKDMSVSEFNNKKSDFYRSIPFKEIIKNDVVSFKEKNGGYYGIHLRFTDRSQFSVNAKYVSDIIDMNPNKKFFICSDDRSSIDYLNSLYKDKIITYPITNLNRASKEGLIQSMIDWLILANSEKIWYSLGSSYSYEACIYNKLSNSVEMNPSNLILDDFIIKLEF